MALPPGANWAEIEELYHSVLDRSPEERQRLLEQASPDVRREVESLLAQQSGDGILHHSVWNKALTPRAPADTRLNPGSQLGRYIIEGVLGEGGMGTVYRARDSRLKRDVAVKVSTDRFSDRFEREARAIAALNHVNICQIYDVGPNYLVMELVEGPTLAERIKQGAIPFDEGVGIARQIANALEAAHEKAITHRDLKPANVKINADGTLKVLDFGLAKIEAIPTVESGVPPNISLIQTELEVILGTAAYMAPEQATGKAADKRADIWAFGVVFFEMLTGRRLFRGETTAEILASVIKEEPDWSRVPAKARLMLRRCLEKDPKKRLRDIGDAMPLLEVMEVTPEPDSSTRTRRTWISLTTATAVVIMAAALTFVYLREERSESQKNLRFQIAVPSRMQIREFSISPDGRRLVYSGHLPEDPTSHLYVRNLDSFESRQLPGTEELTQYPIWSPDSRYVAFIAGGKLQKIDLSGGPAEVICEVGGVPGLGGSWNRENVIIFGTAQGIMRVSANGGAASAVTVTDAGRGEQGHTYPAFLPDGRHFVYARLGAQENRGVYIGSLDVKPHEQGRKPLLTALSAIYVPMAGGSGRLLFLRDGTLFAQRFDTRKLELTGEPVQIAEGVGSANPGAYGEFSASASGVLIYKSDAVAESQLTWYDRDGKVVGTPGERGRYAFIRLSPDNTRAAVNEAGDLWVIDLIRGTKIRLTSDHSVYNPVVWSPDGSYIAYTAYRGGAFRIYRKPSNGSGTEDLLLNTDGRIAVTSWSADGRFLLYQPQSAHEIWILPVQRDRPPLQFLKTEFIVLGPAFSPDGRWIAYRSDEAGRNEIYLQAFNPDADGSAAASGTKWMISKGGSLGMNAWRSDGKELYYLSLDGKLMAVDIATRPVFHAGEPEPLFPLRLDFVGGAGSTPAARAGATADGKRFLFAMPVPRSGVDEFNVVLNWPAALASDSPREMSKSQKRMLLVFACYFLVCSRLSYFKEWQWDVDVDKVYPILAYYNRTYGMRDFVSDWRYGSALNIYHLLYGNDTIGWLVLGPG